MSSMTASKTRFSLAGDPNVLVSRLNPSVVTLQPFVIVQKASEVS